MDPNNIQPINTNSSNQPVPQPASPPPVTDQPIQTIPVAATDPLIPTPAQPPIQQSAPPPPPIADSTPTVMTTPVAAAPVTPKKGNKKVLSLLIILLILALGIGAYILFAKNQLDNVQKASTGNTSIVVPTPTIAPTATPATADQINVESPLIDLSGIETDIQDL